MGGLPASAGTLEVIASSHNHIEQQLQQDMYTDAGSSGAAYLPQSSTSYAAACDGHQPKSGMTCDSHAVCHAHSWQLQRGWLRLPYMSSSLLPGNRTEAA